MAVDARTSDVIDDFMVMILEIAKCTKKDGLYLEKQSKKQKQLLYVVDFFDKDEG